MSNTDPDTDNATMSSPKRTGGNENNTGSSKRARIHGLPPDILYDEARGEFAVDTNSTMLYPVNFDDAFDSSTDSSTDSTDSSTDSTDSTITVCQKPSVSEISAYQVSRANSEISADMAVNSEIYIAAEGVSEDFPYSTASIVATLEYVRNTDIATCVSNGATIIEVNKAWLDDYGYENSDLTASSTFQILTHESTDRDTLAELHDCCRRKEPFKGEMNNAKKDGSVLKVKVEITPIVDGHFLVRQWIIEETDESILIVGGMVQEEASVSRGRQEASISRAVPASYALEISTETTVDDNSGKKINNVERMRKEYTTAVHRRGRSTENPVTTFLCVLVAGLIFAPLTFFPVDLYNEYFHIEWLLLQASVALLCMIMSYKTPPSSRGDWMVVLVLVASVWLMYPDLDAVLFLPVVVSCHILLCSLHVSLGALFFLAILVGFIFLHWYLRILFLVLMTISYHVKWANDAADASTVMVAPMRDLLSMLIWLFYFIAQFVCV